METRTVLSEQEELAAFLTRHKDASIMSLYRVALVMGFKSEHIRYAMIDYVRREDSTKE